MPASAGRAARIRVGVAGCGRIARVHLSAPWPGADVVALADADPANLDAAVRLAPAAAKTADYRDLCTDPDIDAILVCLPSGLHAEAACLALAHGKAIYLEKPLATDLAQGREVAEAWRRSGRPAMIGFNCRFHPLIVEMRNRFRDGEIGDLVGIRSFLSSPAHARPGWKQTVAAGGGVLLDFASHHVDLARFLTGREVADVLASTQSRNCEEDSASLHLTLSGPGNVTMQSVFSWTSVLEDRVELIGTRGSLGYERYTSLAVERRLAASSVNVRTLLAARLTSVSPRYAIRKLAAPTREPSYALAVADFIDSLRTGRSPSPDLDDGLRSLEVIAAARQSASDGRVVRLAR